MTMSMIISQNDILLTFKEAMNYLRVSRSTLYRLMWSGQLTGHKVGSTWRFYREDLRACVGRRVTTAQYREQVAPASYRSKSRIETADQGESLGLVSTEERS